MSQTFVIGADEVGLGAWAGPVVVCAVVAPDGWTLPGLTDSKRIAPGSKKMISLYDQILDMKPFVQVFVEWRWPEDIDNIGIRRCQLSAFYESVRAAQRVQPDARIILDGTLQLHGIAHEAYPKADANYPAVSAASIVAKVERDRWMQTEADSRFPMFGFINHVGYGTAAHQKAMDDFGVCELHRRSYAPVKKAMLRMLEVTEEKMRQEELQKE